MLEAEAASLGGAVDYPTVPVVHLVTLINKHIHAPDGRLRRGPSAILPLSFDFIWKIPIGTTNVSGE